tara:strand:+ start:1699 stop:2109 length:411 start_codon:yes stop_codon:yes gene_type:complete
MIFTSSITGPYVTSPGHGHYSATKAGINDFIKSSALEFSGYGITVNGVEPGNILTDGMKAHRSQDFIKSMEDTIPLGRLGTPLDVANAFLFSLPKRQPISQVQPLWLMVGNCYLKKMIFESIQISKISRKTLITKS